MSKKIKHTSITRYMTLPSVMEQFFNLMNQHNLDNCMRTVKQLTPEQRKQKIIKGILGNLIKENEYPSNPCVKSLPWIYALLCESTNTVKNDKWWFTASIEIKDGLIEALHTIDCDKEGEKYRDSICKIIPNALYHLEKQCVSAYMWNEAGRHVYTLSPELAQMLTHTKLDNLPLGELQLPFPTVEFSIPPGVLKTFPAIAQGQVYYLPVDSIVLSDLRPERDSLQIALVSPPYNETFYPNQRVQTSIPLSPQQTLGSIIPKVANIITFGRREDSPPDEQEAAKAAKKRMIAAVRYAFSAAIYATSVDADDILAATSKEYADWICSLKKKKLTKKERQGLFQAKLSSEYSNKHYLGKHIKIIDRHDYGETNGEKRGTHASPRLHWRAGHFRYVWCGPMDGDRYKEVRWIKPTIVGKPKSNQKLEATKARMQ